MSLGGLALGVGMLVDDAIVVLESIVRHYKDGKPLAKAAYDGTKEVGLAVTASTLTTVVVFLPISFIEGIAGQLFRDLAITVTVSLLVSMISAFALIPMLYSRGLKKEEAPETPQYKYAAARFAFLTFPTIVVSYVRDGIRLIGRFLGKLVQPILNLVDAGLNLFYRSYPTILRSALRHRFAVLFTTFLLLVGSFLLLRNLGIELIPPISQGEFSFQIELPEGTPLNKTENTLKDIERQVRKLSDVKTTMILVGRNANVSWTSAESYENSAVMNVRVQGKDLKQVEDKTTDE